MLRVVHPHGVSDPAGVGGRYVQVGVWVRVDIDLTRRIFQLFNKTINKSDLILPLEAQFVIIDPDMAKLAGDDVHVGGPCRHRDDFNNRLPPRISNCRRDTRRYKITSNVEQL